KTDDTMEKQKDCCGVKTDSGIQRYQSMDLLVWTVLLLLFETIVAKAGSVWFRSQPWTVSLVPALCAIVYMRWGAFGVVYSVLGGIVLCFAMGGGGRQYVVYAVGNILSALVLVVMKKAGKERIRNSSVFSVFFAILVAFLMQAGRGIVSVVLGDSPGAMIDFIATDVLSGAFAAVVVWIARRLDGVFEDQLSYLVRLKAQEDKEKGGKDEG
ncbi:MAG: hypothetical protein ACI4S4_07160, partial [Candidatus Ornithospirochaeta sp.]